LPEWDGTAAFLSSGAVLNGEFNTTLGTTLVLKGLSATIIKDERGRIYCHRHPTGGWLPGGASNVGGECLIDEFGEENLAALDRAAAHNLPTDLLIYPLKRQGERLPFMNPSARGFIEGSPKDRVELYAAHLEGVAYIERLSYELLESLGAEVSDVIYTTGGGAKSDVWMQIRADILNRAVCRPERAESAFGCCVLAAASAMNADLATITRAMVRREFQVEPRREMATTYADRYARFVDECRKRGYTI